MTAAFSLNVPTLFAEIDVSTILLVLVTAGLLFLAKVLADVKRELAELRANQSSPAPGREPASAVAPAAAAPASVVPVAASAVSAAPVPASIVTNGEIDPRIVSVIAAAAHYILRGRGRIVSVSPAHDHSRDWSLEGRRQVFLSHRVR